MNYNWQLLENGAMFETLSELENHLVESGHVNYDNEMHPVRFIGKGRWDKALYSEIENIIGKDTWYCDETTDEFKARYGMKPDQQLGGEFSLEDARKYCKSEPILRVPDQFEFEKGLVKKWLKVAGKETGRGKNPNSLANLKHVNDKLKRERS